MVDLGCSKRRCQEIFSRRLSKEGVLNPHQVPNQSLHSQWQTTRLHSVHGHRDSHLEARANPRRDLTKLEHYELNKYGLAVFRLGPSATFGFEARSDMEAKAAEKSAFDLKLKKYDAAVKIKIIKEVRTFMDLGLKEAKELVEKVPVVNEK
nr:50s ribosomal protein l12, chloroplastic [Quercus suber]